MYPIDTTETFTCYLGNNHFLDELMSELKDIVDIFDRLIIAKGMPQDVYWAQNIWLNPQWIQIDSIGDGAKKLRAIQRNWALYSLDENHRRAQLIQEKLPHMPDKRHVFPNPAPTAPLGSWTLVDKNWIIASPQCSSPFIHGNAEFEENKTFPPNRAYLKLWDVFTRIGKMPKADETCIDLGASPGGWSWVMQECGADVIAVDKAPLDPKIAKLPRITATAESAFALDPKDYLHANWLFSDIICYPEKLLGLVKNWLDAGFKGNMICTIKLQGETDATAIAAFAAIPGSRIMHLHHNKHELTWVLINE